MQPHIEQAVLRTKYDKTGFQMRHILNHPSVDVHVVLKEKKKVMECMISIYGS